jgi:hypothetical protein
MIILLPRILSIFSQPLTGQFLFNKVFYINYFILVIKLDRMKKLTCILFALCILFAACNSKAKEDAAEKDGYEKAKESLEDKEKKNPASFIKVTSKDKHNLIGQTVIKGTVNNNAKICVYKDIELELSFFSKTGVLLEKDIEIIYEVVEPGKSADFKTKYFAPKGTDSVGIKVLAAKVN